MQRKTPIHMEDAANKYYVNNKVMPLNSNGWNCGYRKLTNVKDGTSSLDAINFQQLEELMSLIIDRSLVRDKTKDCFDASSKRICNIADGVKDRDVITRAQLVQAIRTTEAESIRA